MQSTRSGSSTAPRRTAWSSAAPRPSRSSAWRAAVCTIFLDDSATATVRIALHQTLDTGALRHVDMKASSGWCVCDRHTALRVTPSRPESVEQMYSLLKACTGPEVDEEITLAHEGEAYMFFDTCAGTILHRRLLRFEPTFLARRPARWLLSSREGHDVNLHPTYSFDRLLGHDVKLHPTYSLSC